jgi:hypothetical protein
MKFGDALPVRIKQLQDLQNQPNQRTWPFKFRGKMSDFPLCRVAVSLPKYRLNNGRTEAAQEEWLARHPTLRKDLFTADPESDEAQQQQHAILETMVNEEKLLDHFRKNQQDQPLVLSHNGFVVNGNRRLCAFRKLLAEDGNKYRHFNHIDVIVLPAATEQDIYDLEVELQVTEDIKSEYDWLKAAKMLQRGRNQHHLSDDDLARRYHMRNAKEVQEAIQLLEFADAYLESRGTPKQYSKIEKGQYALQELRKEKEKQTRDEDKIALEKITFLYLDNAQGKGRIYGVVPKISTHLPKILKAIADQVPGTAAPVTSGLFGKTDQAKLGVIKTLSNLEKRDAVLEVVTNVLQAEEVKARDSKAANYALTRVIDANTALQDALAAFGERSVKDGMERQLDSVADTVEKLRRRLKA